VRADHKKTRLDGLCKIGYCASLDRYFVGVREHLIFTEDGYLAHIEQIAGNRHDTQGLYALLQTDFQGRLLADNGYWPNPEKKQELLAHGIEVIAQTRMNMTFQYPEHVEEWLQKKRGAIERRIGLFNQQFNAGRTLCRSKKHYEARRCCKALAHNGSRHLNRQFGRPMESLAHYRAAA